MRYLQLCLFTFLISCNTIKKENNLNQAIDSSVDSIRYIGNNDANGLYENPNYTFNLCIYAEERGLIPSNAIFKQKSFFSQSKIANILLKNKLVPHKIITFDNEIIKIIYEDLDSIPRAYYEFTEKCMPNDKRQVGKLYLLYENWHAGNYGKRVFISDTTEKYGFFTLETIISEKLYKIKPLEMKGDKIIVKGLKNNKIYQPYKELNYRIILDEEVIKKK